MTKKRIATMVLLSPILLALGIAILLSASVCYALDGKWELKTMLKENGIKV